VSGGLGVDVTGLHPNKNNTTRIPRMILFCMAY